MRHLISSIFIFMTALSLGAQSSNPLDTATINRIRGEAVANSQAMDTHWWLSEVFGPRATGTPGYQKGADWVMAKFKEWGLQNIHIERFPFGQGWTIERFSAHMITEHSSTPLIGLRRSYSPSTSGTVAADVVQVRATTEAELEKYKGRLRGKIVASQELRPVRMLEDRIVLRMTDADWKEAMTLPEPSPKPAAPTAPATPPFS